MSENTSNIPTLDLYCLSCGYNLRGHEGDPRHCPECGHFSRVEDMEVPAKLIRKALVKLESGAATCGASVATLLFFVLPLVIVRVKQSATSPPAYFTIFLVTIVVAAIVMYVFGMVHFRRSCAGNPRWLSALLWFTAHACLISAIGLAAIVAVLWCVVAVVAMWPALPLIQIGATLGVVLALLAVCMWFYRSAKRAIHPLQRETAARFARAGFVK